MNFNEQRTIEEQSKLISVKILQLRRQKMECLEKKNQNPNFKKELLLIDLKIYYRRTQLYYLLTIHDISFIRNLK